MLSTSHTPLIPHSHRLHDLLAPVPAPLHPSRRPVGAFDRLCRAVPAGAGSARRENRSAPVTAAAPERIMTVRLGHPPLAALPQRRGSAGALPSCKQGRRPAGRRAAGGGGAARRSLLSLSFSLSLSLSFSVSLFLSLSLPLFLFLSLSLSLSLSLVYITSNLYPFRFSTQLDTRSPFTPLDSSSSAGFRPAVGGGPGMPCSGRLLRKFP